MQVGWCAFLGWLCLLFICPIGSRRSPEVFVMEPAHAGHLHHPALARRLHTPWLGCVLRQRQVCPGPVVVEGREGSHPLDPPLLPPLPSQRGPPAARGHRRLVLPVAI